MSEYTPTTADMRHGYIVTSMRYTPETDDHLLAKRRREVADEFDRWLAGERADARREGQVEGMRQAAYVAGDVAPDGMGGNDWFPSEWSDYVSAWLEYRADRIEDGACQ